MELSLKMLKQQSAADFYTFNLGQRLRLERMRLKYSQERLGHLLGVSLGTQNRYEQNSTAPSLSYLVGLQELGGNAAFVVLGDQGPATKGNALSYELTNRQIEEVAALCAQGMRSLWSKWNTQAKPPTFGFAPQEPQALTPAESLKPHQRLRVERERLQLTQAEMASAVKMKTKSIGYYERGQTQPDSLYLARLAAIGFDLPFIFSGSRGCIFENVRNMNCEAAKSA